MATFKLYHTTIVPLPLPPLFPHARWPADYRLVAEIEARDVEGVFCKTNCIDRHWSLQPGVRCFAPHERSTCIGDVVVTPDGRAFRCEGVGWQEL